MLSNALKYIYILIICLLLIITGIFIFVTMFWSFVFGIIFLIIGCGLLVWYYLIISWNIQPLQYLLCFPIIYGTGAYIPFVFFNCTNYSNLISQGMTKK